MVTRMFFSSLGTLSAFLSAICLIRSLDASRRKHDVAGLSRSDQKSRSGWIAWRLRNGVRIFLPLASFLLRFPKIFSCVNEAAGWLEGRGYMLSQRSLLSSVLTALGLAMFVSGVITRSVIGALAVGICAVASLAIVLGGRREKRGEHMRDALPDVIGSMETCFDAGLSLQQTFNQIRSQTKEPMRTLFARALHRLEVGGSIDEALAELQKVDSVSELSFLAVALDVQHQTGGSIRQVLEATKDAVEGEIGLRRALKVQTAQAKLSARVVSIMPFVLIAIFSLISENFLAPFFSSPAGYVLLIMALGMEAAGIMMVRGVLATVSES